jgi:hypothetical protein
MENAIEQIKFTIGTKLNNGKNMYTVFAEMIDTFGKDIATLILVDVAISYGRMDEAKAMMQRHFPEECKKRTK